MSLLLAVALFAAGNTTAVVARPVANMYAQPTEDAQVVSQAIYGTNVGILETRPGWARVRTPDEYTGWMPLASLLEGSYGKGRTAMVDSLFAHLYREPDVTTHQPVLTVPFEARLEILRERDERWLEVRLAGGAAAWVQRGDLLLDPKPLSIDQTIALAKRFLGLPYTWGGASSFGYDCSGFTQMLCRRRGIFLPRDAAPQANWSGLEPVARTALRPGDLLYFGASAAKIVHTGMYIGQGRFIHATAHLRPMVQISDLDDPHWAALLVASRRPR